VLLGVEAGEAVGYLHYEIVDKPQSEYLLAQKYVHVHALSIKAEHRRKGYGEQLLEYVIQFAQAQGIPGVRLEVWAFNEGAQAFYRRRGFRTFELKMLLDLD
jgi:ribosomal protein S18 acetylase RimI-like enzyme